jgi:Uma2 family endonuclease
MLMSAVMDNGLPRHRFNVDEYYRMAEVGLLSPDAPVELIEGQIIDITDRGAPDTDHTIDSRDLSKAMRAASDSWTSHHRFTEEEYYRMVEVGVLAPDARVELIEGEIIDMAPIGSLHCGTVDWLTRTFVAAMGRHAIVRIQGVVRLHRFSHPQPDIAVLRPRADFYRAAHPGGAETSLVIEVSESSLWYDREVKVPLYAHHGVPEVWIVDLEHSQLHFYRSLTDGTYADVSFTSTPGLTPLSALPGVTVDLSGLFAL